MTRRNVTRNGCDMQQLPLFSVPAEERMAPIQPEPQPTYPNHHHIHVEVHFVEGSRAILYTASAKDLETLQRHTTEVRFVGGVSEPRLCPICHPVQVEGVKAPDLTLDDLTVFSLDNLRGVRDRARRIWLRIWAETHDCPEEHLMYSESGYYQVPFWPVGKQQLLYRIKHGSGLLIYSLFVHCLGLRLEVCLREAIARGEIKDPYEEDL